MAWRRALEPLISPTLRAYWRLSRGMTLGVRTAVTDEAGRFLLVRHTYRAGWFLPGGGVEKAETALDAALRETEEEAGVAAEGPPTLFGVYANHQYYPNDHVILYRYGPWRRIGAPRPDEIAEAGFFAPDALPEGATPGTRRRIAELTGAAPISPQW